MDCRSIYEAITELKVITAETTQNLKEHMRRTELLENHVTTLNGELIKLKTLFMVCGWIFASIAAVAGPLLEWWVKR